MTKSQAEYLIKIECENEGTTFIELESYSDTCIEYVFSDSPAGEPQSTIIYL